MFSILYARSTARIRNGHTLAHCRCCGQTQPFVAYKYRTSRIVLGIPSWTTTGVFYGTCDICGAHAEWPLEATTVRRWKRPHGVLKLAERLGVDTAANLIQPPVTDSSVRGVIERAEADPDGAEGLPSILAVPYLLSCVAWSAAAVYLCRRGVLTYADEFGTGFSVALASLVVMYFVTRAIWRWDRRRNHARRMVRRLGKFYREDVQRWLAAPPESSEGEILREAVRIALGHVAAHRVYSAHRRDPA